MKNRDKYPNTDDAVKAYEEHKKEYNCDCTFEDWLDLDDDKIKEFMDEFDNLFAASLFGPIGLGLLASLKRRRDKDASPKPDEGNGGETKGVECPLCNEDIIRAPFGNSSPDEFKAWFFKHDAKKD